MQSKAFLFIAMLFGLMMVFITPPLQSPDEGAHFMRSYQVSEGHTKAECINKRVGGKLPAGLRLFIQQFPSLPFHPEIKQDIRNVIGLLSVPLREDEREFMEFPMTALYSPIVYAPQAIAILLGRVLGLSALMLMYLGRIGNLLVWAGLIYLSIKKTPVCKWGFLLMALTPMSLFLAASLSADVILNGLSFFFIASVLKFAYDKGSIMRKRDLLLTAFVLFLLALCKQVYIALVLLLFIIPLRKAEVMKRAYLLFLLLVILSMAAMILWSFINRDIVRAVVEVYVPNAIRGADPGKQINFILAHPIRFVGVLYKTIGFYGADYFKQFVGVLGWLDTPLPDTLVLFYLIVLVVISVIDGSEQTRVSFSERIIFMSILLLSSALIFASLYILWTGVEGAVVEGVQGRYFIPVSPLILIVLYSKSGSRITNRTIFKASMVLLLILVHIYTICILIQRYYQI